jgi:hypothetical protein
MPDPEKLTRTMKTGVMTDRNFSHSESRDIEFPRHFHADDAAPRLESNSLEYVSAEQTEVAIHISNREAKRESHRAPVHLSDNDAVPRVGAFYFEAIHQVDIRTEFGKKIVNLADIVLPITVGIKDEIFCRVGETGNERSSITAVGFVVNDT